MKKGLYLATTLLFTACTQPETTRLESQTEAIETEILEPISEEHIHSKQDSVSIVESYHTGIKRPFNGNWFRIFYPSNFMASPTSPTRKVETGTIIETDEAYITSPDGTVEFFVFSPQWSGDPIDYLVQQPNEKTVSRSEDKADSDDPFAVSHNWVTYEDKDGQYTRSYHSLRTESTHRVFGVKYTNRKMYKKYKAAYLAFKRSLQQFAD